MDSRTGEIFTPSDVESARKKIAAGDLDSLTDRERNFIIAEHHGMVAWITPELAEQVERGRDVILQKRADDLQAQFREWRDKVDGKSQDSSPTETSREGE